MTKDEFLQSLNELRGLLNKTEGLYDSIAMSAEKIIYSIKNGGKLMICGNGGSAADAQHMAAEFVNRFLKERAPLPAIALSVDTSNITSIANDYSFDEIFSKQVEALGKNGDVLIGISTSGNSNNVLRAIEAAKKRNIFTIGLLGKDGGKIGQFADLSLIVESNSTPRIQEMHILIIHTICQIVEEGFCG
jgi:D-sedoheptulose 7-phosphate isomerase